MDIYQAHKRVRTHVDSLLPRMLAQKEWIKRHPDYRTFAYLDDERNYEENSILSFESTFDPADPMPSTSDILTAELFLSVMMLALHACEGLSNDEEKEAD